jgi:hypothetical protein
VNDVYTVVGAVMWLGNVRFQEQADAVDGDAEIAPSGGAADSGADGGCSGDEEERAAGAGGNADGSESTETKATEKLAGREYSDLHRCCKLLQVERSALEQALCTRNMKVCMYIICLHHMPSSYAPLV